MQRGKDVITSMDNNANVQTAAPTTDKNSTRTWKVVKVGNKYSFVNPAGQTLYYNTVTNFFAASTNPTGTKEFQIVTTKNNELKGFEMYTGSGDKAYLNRWGGFGMGMKLRLWTLGDGNNTLQFVLPNDIVITDTKPANVTEVTLSGIASWTPTNKHFGIKSLLPFGWLIPYQ